MIFHVHNFFFLNRIVFDGISTTVVHAGDIIAPFDSGVKHTVNNKNTPISRRIFVYVSPVIHRTSALYFVPFADK